MEEAAGSNGSLFYILSVHNKKFSDNTTTVNNLVQVILLLVNNFLIENNK